jgi:hypothetical protein
MPQPRSPTRAFSLPRVPTAPTSSSNPPTSEPSYEAEEFQTALAADYLFYNPQPTAVQPTSDYAETSMPPMITPGGDAPSAQDEDQSEGSVLPLLYERSKRNSRGRGRGRGRNRERGTYHRSYRQESQSNGYNGTYDQWEDQVNLGIDQSYQQNQAFETFQSKRKRS